MDSDQRARIAVSVRRALVRAARSAPVVAIAVDLSTACSSSDCAAIAWVGDAGPGTGGFVPYGGAGGAGGGGAGGENSTGGVSSTDGGKGTGGNSGADAGGSRDAGLEEGSVDARSDGAVPVDATMDAKSISDAGRREGGNPSDSGRD